MCSSDLQPLPHNILDYVINGKLIFGMFGLEASHVKKMDIYADNVDDLLESIDKFIYRERLLGNV